MARPKDAASALRRLVKGHAAVPVARLAVLMRLPVAKGLIPRYMSGPRLAMAAVMRRPPPAISPVAPIRLLPPLRRLRRPLVRTALGLAEMRPTPLAGAASKQAATLKGAPKAHMPAAATLPSLVTTLQVAPVALPVSGPKELGRPVALRVLLVKGLAALP